VSPRRACLLLRRTEPPLLCSNLPQPACLVISSDHQQPHPGNHCPATEHAAKPSVSRLSGLHLRQRGPSFCGFFAPSSSQIPIFFATGSPVFRIRTFLAPHRSRRARQFAWQRPPAKASRRSAQPKLPSLFAVLTHFVVRYSVLTNYPHDRSARPSPARTAERRHLQ
jgi:hypothetical protein